MNQTAIAVFGCGNIGSRALQAVAKLERPATIYAIDPMPDALVRAQARVAELGEAARARIEFAESPAALPETIDLALVSTCADTRRATVEALLERAHVRNLVLDRRRGVGASRSSCAPTAFFRGRSRSTGSKRRAR